MKPQPEKILKRYPLLVAGVAILLLSLLLDYALLPAYHKYKANNLPETIQKQVIAQEAVADSLAAEIRRRNQAGTEVDFQPLADRAAREDLLVYVYRGGKLVYWQTNQVLPRPGPEVYRAFRTVERGKGVYLQRGSRAGPYTVRVLKPLKQDYSLENEYLKSRLLLADVNAQHLAFNRNQQGAAILNSNQDYLFSLKPDSSAGHRSSGLKWLYLLGTVLGTFGFTGLISRLLFRRYYKAGIGMLAMSSVLLMLNHLYLQFPALIYQGALFEPGKLPQGLFFSSVGGFALVVLLLTFFIHYVTKHLQLPSYLGSRANYLGLLGLFFMLTVGASHCVVMALQNLVIDSAVYLNVKEVKRLDLLSLVTIVTTFLLFYNLIVSAFWFYNQLKTFIKNNYVLVIGCFLVLILSYQLFSQFSVYANHYAGLFALLLWLGFLAFYPSNPSFYGPLIYLILISSGFAAIHLINFNENKSLQRQKRFATQVTYQRDAVAEELFGNVSREIKQDQYTKNYFLSPLLPKSFLKRRIKQLYLSRYLNKYNFKLHTYKYGGIPYKGSSEHSLDYFRQLVEKYGLKASAKNLYYINKTGTNSSYLAIYNFNAYGGQFGTMVIELQKKVFYEDRIYPALLLRGDLKNKDRTHDYNYAIYKNNRLIAQKGNYPYTITDQFEGGSGVYNDFKEGQYHHLSHQVSHNTFVVVSRQTSNVLNKLSVFSFLFILFFILSVISISFQKQNFQQVKDLSRAVYQRDLRYFKPFKHLLFQRKIQLVILLTALMVMVTVGVSTVNYLRYSFNEQLNSELSQKTKKIIPLIEQFLKENEGGRPIYSNREELFAEVKKLTRRFQTDINLYNTDGELITTSQPRIYKKGILTRQMDPLAFKRMKVDKQAQTIQNEQIGKLEYLASYAPIRDSDNKIIGFLNLPYFSKQPVLQQEISSLLVTLVDLYVLIFLFVLIISLFISNTLTQPLDLIREKLRKTQLGQTNEPINWESRDELGQLIQEYNQMVSELERNAATLAQSEREGAWREMARQVAHEIKNPLTPMKLNIQRLQQQFPQNGSDQNQHVHRVSKILTTQIDHLSKIATDFSAFAQLSLGSPVSLDIHQELENLVEFFDQEERSRVTLDLSPTPPFVWIDPNHFNRILTNLIKNAFEAIPEDREGKVEIGTCGIKDQYVCLWVSDNGKGIPTDEQAHIFQPNFSTKGSGTGLGLAMINKMMESAGGSITFTSLPDEGTTFYLYFQVVSHQEATHRVPE